MTPLQTDDCVQRNNAHEANLKLTGDLFATSTDGVCVSMHIGVLTEQCGHTNPLMFSTIPRMRKPVFLQNVISLLTSPVDTACTE